MSKQTSTIVTIVVGVLTLLCCTMPLCVSGILILAGLGEWNTEFGPSSQTGAIPSAYGIAPCCLSILVLVVPLLLWLFLVRGKEDAIPTFPGEYTDDVST
jgi:uncharacterized BrkB/YihY/UPF0761 family membrane protein